MPETSASAATTRIIADHNQQLLQVQAKTYNELIRQGALKEILENIHPRELISVVLQSARAGQPTNAYENGVMTLAFLSKNKANRPLLATNAVRNMLILQKT